MTGYKEPPKDTRFKKGQSGNPNGRPKGSGTLNQASRVTLEAARRKVTIREGGVARELPAVDAIQLAQQKSALGGSALAQKHFLDRYEKAEAARREQIDGENEVWAGIAEMHRTIIADASKRGVAPPRLYPHPDDIVTDPEHGVRFVGPLDEEDELRLQKTLKVRDLLFAHDAFDRRAWNEADLDDPERGPGTAALLAHMLDRSVPERHRLSDAQILTLMWRYDRMTKRELTKMLFQSWKALGIPLPRASAFPSIGFGKRSFISAYETLRGMREEAA